MQPARALKQSHHSHAALHTRLGRTGMTRLNAALCLQLASLSYTVEGSYSRVQVVYPRGQNMPDDDKLSSHEWANEHEQTNERAECTYE